MSKKKKKLSFEVIESCDLVKKEIGRIFSNGAPSEAWTHFRSSAWIISLSLSLSPLLSKDMADSDEEYVGEVTEDEDDLQVTRGDNSRARRKQRGGAEWELSRTWETLVEGADGTINSTVEGLLEAGKRKRSVRFPYSVCPFLLNYIVRPGS